MLSYDTKFYSAHFLSNITIDIDDCRIASELLTGIRKAMIFLHPKFEIIQLRLSGVIFMQNVVEISSSQRFHTPLPA
jgi:hypothetical protein